MNEKNYSAKKNLINSTYNYYINNTNIEATISVTSKLVITIDDITDINLNEPITLIEERIFLPDKFEIEKPIFNNLMQIDLVNNYNPQNKSSVFNTNFAI